MVWLVAVAVVFLAFSNGANDNFKGVATLYGSGTASYRTALAWATVTTLAGSLLALALAAGLVKSFSAKGLVPDAIASSPRFLAAAALGAACTVVMATRLGMPVSTTHGLTGALVGAGLASGAAVDLSVLGKGFVLPLLLSPCLSSGLAAGLYTVVHRARLAAGIQSDSCVCVGTEVVATSAVSSAAVVSTALTVATGTTETCAEQYQGSFVGVPVQKVVDGFHFLSAGGTSFARGLNDTPKIVALLIAARALEPNIGLGAVGAAMAVGGLLGARRVAETLSSKIVVLNPGQGLVSNLVTASLVIAASRYGLPVSTTHVATGGLFGIGAVTGGARWKTILSILIAWVTTLPMGALLGGLAMLVLTHLTAG